MDFIVPLAVEIMSLGHAFRQRLVRDFDALFISRFV